MDKRIAVTGIGIIASNAIGRAEFWKAIRAGKTGIRPVTLFDMSSTRTKTAGEVAGFRAEDFLGDK